MISRNAVLDIYPAEFSSQRLRRTAPSLGRVSAFHVVAVGCRVRRSRFGHGWLFGGTHSAWAVVAPLLDVVVFGERGNHRGAAGNLADAVENNLRSAIVHFYRAMNFNAAAFQAPLVTHVFEAMSKDDDRKGAGHLVFAKVEEVDALAAH